MTRAVFDVCIIGGGPAGAAAAGMLASQGHAVCVVTRAGRPRAFAESLPPSIAKLLDRLQLRDVVDAGGFIRATGNTVQWAGGDRRVEMFDTDLAGYQVPRDEFDRLLLNAAAARGATVVRDATVIDAKRSGDEWRVTIAAADPRREIRARWVLDASGRAGVLAARTSRVSHAGSRTLAVAGVWAEPDMSRVSEPSHTLVESYAGGWAWSVPLDDARRVITVMLDPSMTDVGSRAKLTDAYLRELSRTSMIGELTVGASLRDEPWGCDASPFTTARAASEQALLVGDAASFIDPLSSFGVKKALASAWLASVVVHSGLRDSAMIGPGEALFNEREAEMFEQLQRQSSELASGAAAAHASEFWMRRAMSAETESTAVGAIDIASLRDDARVARAFEELKRRPAMHLRVHDSTRFVDRAVVSGNELVLERHLVGAGLRKPTRYLQNVDMVLLTQLAPERNDVSDLFDAYNRVTRVTSASLPAFLAALSTLIGLELLVFA